MIKRKKKLPNALFLRTDCIIHTKIKPVQISTQASIKRLCESIRIFGMINPITVRKCGNVYELIAGEKRLMAARILGMEYVPCIVVEIGEKAAAEISVSENLVRTELDFFKEADCINSLVKNFSVPTDEISRLFAKTPSEIQNFARLMKLSHSERYLILSNKLTKSQALSLVKINDAKTRKRIMQKVIAENLSVKETSDLVSKATETSEDSILLATLPEKPLRKLIIKDLRLFENSVGRAVSGIKKAGINADISTVETETGIIYTIKIEKEKMSA